MTIIEAYNHPDFVAGNAMARPVGWTRQAVSCIDDGVFFAYPPGLTPYYPNRGAIMADWEIVSREVVEAERAP